MLDHLGLDRFLTLGRSGGGRHALACAAPLPDRCSTGWPAWAPENVEEYTAAATSREDPEAFLRAGAEEMATVTGEQVAASFSGLVDEVDRNALTGDIAEGVAAGVRHALSRGTDGWFDDDIAFVTPWGFGLAAITAPVLIWHGGNDRFVPPSHGEWLAAHVSGARSDLHAHEGHISLVRQPPRILDDLGGG